MAIQISGTSVIFDNRNIDNVGVFTATSFVGDGSNLSNLPASGGSITATASGAISNGDPVVINTDGTVSGVSTSGQNESFGSAVEWKDDATFGDQQRQIAYDTTNDKIAIVYKNSSNYPEIVIGTVSGSSITFGTPVTVLSSATGNPTLCYDPDEDRMVVFCDHRAKSGQISGNSITFGSEQTYSDMSSRAITVYDAIYDTDQKKIILFFRPGSGSGSIAQYAGASVGIDVSGDTLTFGYEGKQWDSGTVSYVSAVYMPHVKRHLVCYRGDSDEHGQVVVGALDGATMNAANTDGGLTYESRTEFDNVNCMFNRLAYDSDSQKAVVAYSDDDASRHVTAKVIDVVPSGRTAGYVQIGPRFRIKTTNSSTTDAIGVAYDPTVKKVVFIYQDTAPNPNVVRVNTASVDGFNLTMAHDAGTIIVSATINHANAVYDPDTEKVITAFVDTDDGDAGDAFVITTAGATSNLTSTNFLGISNAAYSDGDTATIQTVGAEDDAQSGLTVGEKHYVNRDGSISVTAGSPSALVGVANASTKIIIGG